MHAAQPRTSLSPTVGMLAELAGLYDACKGPVSAAALAGLSHSAPPGALMPSLVDAHSGDLEGG